MTDAIDGTNEIDEIDGTERTEGTDGVVLYGSGWCPHTLIVRRRLDLWHVPYRYVDVDANPDAERRIADWNNGRAVRPTLDIGGEIYVNPDPSDLKALLAEHGALT